LFRKAFSIDWRENLSDIDVDDDNTNEREENGNLAVFEKIYI
jgi:hypothetical protein